MEDALDHSSALFSATYASFYAYMVGKLPGLWEKFFELSDQAWFSPVFCSVRRVYNALNAGPLVRLVTEGEFDVVVSTHFFATEVCGYLRQTGKLRSRLVTIVTDYDVHRIWLSSGVDLYLVACEHTRERLIALGVDPGRVRVTGIPVDEKFLAPRDKQEIRRKLGLRPEAFTALVSTSSFGFGPIDELAEQLKDVQLILICGNNKALAGKIAARKNPLHKVCGFVNNMEEMLAATDVMVTKPGGLSITEALSAGLPMIFFSAIPGQEAGNVAVLERYKIGSSGQSLPDIAAKIHALASSPERLAAARAACAALARPRSVEDIIRNLS